ncbi:hypothetical protein ASE01_09590 [Nocardioides sp. Root190]|uniref:hypothetical protein n=1 Tax=Nocardioides sp. Root190 TaxID=1736488 RepID=UPI0006FDDF9B|nr:hypothetical protein [Nocardioides sp. Root190]KRB77007.1 hypothetical protein ASE01_09590 [Nocardioides sp. Root190]
MHHTPPLQLLRLVLRRRRAQRDERGDVPGWVLITVMTISIGVGLWGVAQPQLVSILQSALNSVR